MVENHNIKFKSLYIDMDLAMPRNSISPRVRRLQKSLDSHEEFEFTMSTSNMSCMKDDIFEPAMEVASADKLFFRGQLLPLQPQDPKQQLAHTIVFPKEEVVCGEKGAPLNARHYAEFLSFQLPNQATNYACEEGSPLQFSSQIGTCHPIKQAASYDEGVIPSEFSLRDQIELMRSCRLDCVFDPFKNDSRSSSFRSHRSSYWSSGEKDSRDSISSSRCSIGSYQDSSFQSAERKAPQISMIKAKHPVNTNASAEIEECNIGVFNAYVDPPTIHGRDNHGKPPLPSSHIRKWSWKGFFTGLGKASKLKVDEERGDKGKVKGKGEIKQMNKRPVFTFKELPGAMGQPASYNRRSVGHDWEWQANTYRFVCSEGSSVKKGRKPAREDNYEDQQMGTVYCVRSGGRQEAASINGSSSSILGNYAGEGTSTATKKEKRKVLQGNTTTWNAKESWNRCVNRVKKGTRLSTYNSSSTCNKLQPKQLILPMQGGKNMNAAMNMMNEEDKMDIYRGNYMKAKSLSSTPLAKSPVRTRADEYNGISRIAANGGGGYGSLYCMQGGAAGVTSLAASSSSSSSSSSMKNMNKKVGFAASCPASMRSSPHHSGLLAVVNNKATPDLHTAIQGAIAYCKQSQAALNPPP